MGSSGINETNTTTVPYIAHAYLKKDHKAGTKVVQKTTETTAAASPCDTQTTTPAPCAPETTTSGSPCATVKKFADKEMPSAASKKTQVSMLGMVGWAFGGFAGVG